MSDNDPIPYILVDRPPKVGDRVHVEYDGKVASVHQLTGRLFVKPDGGASGSYVHGDFAAVLVEPVKVGDVIDAVDAAKLPADSAVLCETNAAVYVRPRRQAGLWHGDTRMITLPRGETCRVLHIGGQR